MAEERERMIAKSYRLPAADVEFIEKLVLKRILGPNRSAVVRTLLAYAIKDLVQNDFVRKYRETMAQLDE